MGQILNNDIELWLKEVKPWTNVSENS